MAGAADGGGPSSDAVARVSARIERLPMSAWHWRMLAIVGTADFFDAFDSLTTAFVMPILAKAWAIPPSDIGLLISSGFIGQALGAIGLSWLAEKRGRVALLTWTLAIVAALSVACAFAWNFQSLFWTRAAQGLALGAEVPLAATYMNEIVMAKYRGRFTQGIQAVFAFGVLISSYIAAAVVPVWGWQSMFVLGALPALLAVSLRWLLPESPRWLAAKGRLAEADQVMTAIEKDVSRGGARPLPEPRADFPAARQDDARFAQLFEGIYLKRTLTCWLLLFCVSYVGYGLLTWIPSIFSTAFHLPPAEALNDSFIVGLFGFCGTISGLFLIDRMPRRAYFTLSFVGAGLPLLTLGLRGSNASVTELMALVSMARVFMAFSLTGVYVYAPEVYPTRMRALGAGVASSFMRIASIVGPIAIGWALGAAGIGAVFAMFAVVAFVGAATALFLLVEGRGKVLEDLSP
jgi:putative MFS transporter